jgi:ribosomal protein L2
MSVRKLKPITSAQRFRVVNGFDSITTDKPEKSLLAPKKRSGGRNSQGKMTMRYKGGGHKRKYRIIDFKREKRLEFQQRLNPLNTIQTEQHLLLCLITKTVRSDM